MPNTTPRPSPSTQAIDSIDEINRTLRRSKELSDMLVVLADCVAHQKQATNSALAAWPGVLLVQEEISEGVSTAQAKAHELYELTLSLEEGGTK